ncbi:Spy/CpxP family protein refolding chaperone [Neisseria weixii]|uniref:Spy/CpxP family protein refolding chaperone n=1 Tax=Neisseria weixii TaxID=1853276 RepID=UPI0035A18484
MMKKYIAVAAASLIGLAGVASAADAVSQNSRPAKHGHMHKHGQKMYQKGELPRDLQELNLSSKQKAQIQKIMEANRPQQADKRQAPDAAKRAEFQQKMQQRRAAEQALITGKNFDEAAARRLVNERQAEFEQHAAERKQRMADMEVKRLKERHDIFQVLTAKQQKQLLENQQKRQQERVARKAQSSQPGQPNMQGEPRPDMPPMPQN